MIITTKTNTLMEENNDERRDDVIENHKALREERVLSRLPFESRFCLVTDKNYLQLSDLAVCFAR